VNEAVSISRVQENKIFTVIKLDTSSGPNQTLQPLEQEGLILSAHYSIAG